MALGLDESWILFDFDGAVYVQLQLMLMNFYRPFCVVYGPQHCSTLISLFKDRFHLGFQNMEFLWIGIIFADIGARKLSERGYKRSVDVIINVDEFSDYKSGIYYGKYISKRILKDMEENKDTEENVKPRYGYHSLLLVGYDIIDGLKVWICPNCWGKNWGMHGYIYLLRDVSHRLLNCDVTYNASFPTMGGYNENIFGGLRHDRSQPFHPVPAKFARVFLSSLGSARVPVTHFNVPVF